MCMIMKVNMSIFYFFNLDFSFQIMIPPQGGGQAGQHP